MWKSNVAPSGISSTCEQPVEHKGSINHAEEWLMFPECSLVSRRSSEFSECGKLIQVVDSGRSAKVSKSSGTDGKPMQDLLTCET